MYNIPERVSCQPEKLTIPGLFDILSETKDPGSFGRNGPVFSVFSLSPGICPGTGPRKADEPGPKPFKQEGTQVCTCFRGGMKWLSLMCFADSRQPFSPVRHKCLKGFPSF